MKTTLIISTKLLAVIYLMTATMASTSAKSLDEYPEEVVLFDSYLRGLYENLQMPENSSKPSYYLFKRGLIGYYNILANGKAIVNKKLTLIDFRISSQFKRMWIIDMEENKVLYHRLVAHGKNTGMEYAESFSNIKNSNQSSLGFYLTGENYYGKHGLSLRLDGIETGFNDLARPRAIVIHSANYVNKDFIKHNGRLGRSFGCPAIALNQHEEIIKGLAEKSVLFIYYPKPKYETGTLLSNEQKAAAYYIKHQKSYMASITNRN
jgi:hypothetical protein